MTYTAVGLLLLIPFSIATDIGARARNEAIPAHRKPGIAFNPAAMLLFNVVWVILLLASLTFLFMGSGWWAILLFPGGMMAVGMLQAIVKTR